jgi:hypothetical protein
MRYEETTNRVDMLVVVGIDRRYNSKFDFWGSFCISSRDILNGEKKAEEKRTILVVDTFKNMNLQNIDQLIVFIIIALLEN